MLPGKIIQTRGLNMKAIIKFLTGCYEWAIVVSFFGSLLVWIGIILLCVLGALMVEEWEQWQAMISVLTVTIISTGFEVIFLIILGGAAILVDIRNEIRGVE